MGFNDGKMMMMMIMITIQSKMLIHAVESETLNEQVKAR